MALVPLALLSTAWTASLAGVGSASASAEDKGGLPDGTSVPTQAIEDPASYSAPGTIGLGVQGSGDSIVQAASTNGIPDAALAAYQRAETVINAADEGCHLPWQLIAAIGRVESDHGRYGGNSLGTDGVSRPGIYGIPLNGGNNTQAIADTDAGQFDNDIRWDRAVGPMQFIPSTWSVVGVDADGDARRNPQDIDDAALASAVYLCSGDDDLSTEAGQRASVHRYNHSQAYVDLVLRIMDAYLQGDYTAVPNNTTSAITFTPDYDYTRPTFSKPKATRTGGGSGSSATGGSSTGGSTATGGGSTSDDGSDDPTDDPTEAADKPLETVTKPLKPVTEPVVDVLSAAEAAALCDTELSGLVNPLLYPDADERCAARVEGKTRDEALAIIPNTLAGILVWLGL
jgi:hypothetical protein